MTSSPLTEWDHHNLRVALLEICSNKEGITIYELRRHPRLVPYVRADVTLFRRLLDGMVLAGLIFKRGATSGKVYGPTRIGLLVLDTYRANPPSLVRYSGLNQDSDAE